MQLCLEMILHLKWGLEIILSNIRKQPTGCWIKVKRRIWILCDCWWTGRGCL